ncbi:hypothetical protein NQZ68_031382 [Dissostichus eleginoides]|nr:hypothetical protein NQZ68_031382 [Dissostichus eleginoides]
MHLSCAGFLRPRTTLRNAQNHCKERQNSLLHLILIAPQIPPIHSSQMQQRQTIHYQPILLTALHISQTQ